MRYLKTFENHNNYEDFTETEAFVKPNVSYCIQLNEVHYNPIDTRLIVKYNVTDASVPTLLYSYYEEGETTAALLFDKVEIDDIEVSITDLDTAEGVYQLSVGEHTVKYTLKDPTSIARYTFLEGCTSITSVTIPNSVTSIGDSAFGYCTGLTSVIIGNFVTYIGNAAFAGCSGLTSMKIPNSVTSIGYRAFSQCTNLASVNIPNSVTTIGQGAFCNCPLDSATIAIISAINADAVKCIK